MRQRSVGAAIDLGPYTVIGRRRGKLSPTGSDALDCGAIACVPQQ